MEFLLCKNVKCTTKISLYKNVKYTMKTHFCYVCYSMEMQFRQEYFQKLKITKQTWGWKSKKRDENYILISVVFIDKLIF